MRVGDGNDSRPAIQILPIIIRMRLRTSTTLDFNATMSNGTMRERQALSVCVRVLHLCVMGIIIALRVTLLIIRCAGESLLCRCRLYHFNSPLLGDACARTSFSVFGRACTCTHAFTHSTPYRYDHQQPRDEEGVVCSSGCLASRIAPEELLQLRYISIRSAIVAEAFLV